METIKIKEHSNKQINKNILLPPQQHKSELYHAITLKLYCSNNIIPSYNVEQF